MLLEIVLAFVIVLVAAAMLGVGLLLTGKAKLRGGMCGRVPTQKRSKEQGCETTTSCSVCGKSGEEDETQERT